MGITQGQCIEHYGAGEPYLPLLEAYGTAGQPEEGREVLREGLAEGNNTGGRCFEAELYRLKGELMRL